MENEGMTTDEFIDYCWDFYRPMGLYGYFFDNSLRKSELVLAVKLRKMQGNYAADSFDREAVRDIILQARGVTRSRSLTLPRRNNKAWKQN